jgi:hypothetical protein
MRREENKKHKKPLTVKLTASKNPADFGDIVTLTAEAAEGTAGYKYTWGGCAEDAKDAQAKVMNSRECKPCTATVTVTDQDDETASASVTIKCTALKVKLTKESPKENSVPVGGKATFLAEVFSGDKPASGSFTYTGSGTPTPFSATRRTRNTRPPAIAVAQFRVLSGSRGRRRCGSWCSARWTAAR